MEGDWHVSSANADVMPLPAKAMVDAAKAQAVIKRFSGLVVC